MAEHWTCIECEELYDDTDGDTDERMCNQCIDGISYVPFNKEERINWVMDKVDELINSVTKDYKNE